MVMDGIAPDREQDIGGEGLRDSVGDAMHARGALAQARDHIRRNSGQIASQRMRRTMHLKLPPPE